MKNGNLLQRLLLTLALLAFVSLPKSSHGFALSGFSWQIDANTPICWALDPNFATGVTRSETEIRNLIAEALLEWQNVETSVISFQECALPNVDLDDFGGEDTDTIIVQINSSIGASTGGCSSFELNTTNLVCNGGAVNFSPGAANSSEDGFKATILHEFGHAVGLAHSDKKSVMSYHYDSFTLTTDDKAAISFLYPTQEVEDFAPPGCGTIDLTPPGGGGGPPLGFILFTMMIVLGTIGFRRRAKLAIVRVD